MFRMLEFVQRLKKSYKDKFGRIDYTYDSPYTSVVEKWAVELGNPYFTDMIKLMYINPMPGEPIYLFKYRGYDQVFAQVEPSIFWTMDDGFFRYCRSITINVETEEVVLVAYDKFFNIDELPEVSADKVAKMVAMAKTVQITDKMDGSLQTARWYNGRLVMSGSSALDRNLSFRLDGGYKFIENSPNYIQMLQAYPETSFIFEYIMPDDPHVVIYDYNSMKGLYLTGARDVRTGEMMDYVQLNKIASQFGVMMTQIENVSFEEIMNSRDKYLCGEKEGWVVYVDGLRVKVKCDDFINLHGLLSGYRKTGPRLGNAVMKAFTNDSIDDLLSRMPGDYRKEAEAVLDAILDYIKRLDNYVCDTCERMKEECGAPDDVKTFMLYTTKNCPKEIYGYVCNTYKGYPNNYLKNLRWKDVVANYRLPENKIGKE